MCSMFEFKDFLLTFRNVHVLDGGCLDLENLVVSMLKMNTCSTVERFPETFRNVHVIDGSCLIETFEAFFN